MKKTILTTSFCLLLCVLCIQCQSKTKSTNIDQSDIIPETMQETLKKQLLYGANRYSIEAGLEYPHPDFSKEYFDASVYLSKKILSSNGYKNPINEDFYKKIEKIFDRILDSTTISSSLYVNFLEKCNKTYRYEIQDNVNVYGTYIIKDENFIMDFHYIPELIDYIKEYPQLALVEDTIIVKKGDLSIYRWKDLVDRTDEYNLAKNRKYYQDLLINRNKYLFNDSKASLTWLKFNDIGFLESLVKTFGYVNDKDLLHWVISQTFSNKDNKEEDYNSLFFMKNCSNQFVFHKATFDVLKEKIDSTSMAALQNYINNRERNQELQNLPFAQKAQVLAYTLYIGEFFAQQEQYSDRFAFKFMGPFYEYEDQRDKYDEEFKKNNYYNLPDFEQLWKEGKEYGDGIGLPM